MDNMGYIEINLSCSSEFQEVSLSCGVGYETESNTIDLQDVDWIFSGLHECFWENYFEFEDGINAAKKLSENNTAITFEQALFTVFGHFTGTYFVNGEETFLDYNIDFDELMYNLLSS